MRHPTLKPHPSPLGHGWELVGGHCCPTRHTQPALPTHLPAPGPVEEVESEEDEEENDDAQRRKVESSDVITQKAVILIQIDKCDEALMSIKGDISC